MVDRFATVRRDSGHSYHVSFRDGTRYRHIRRSNFGDSSGGSPLSIPVNLVITAPVTLLPSPSKLNFTYSQGGSAPSAQSVQIPSPSIGSVASRWRAALHG